MIALLARFAIRDYQNTADTRVRQAYGMLCGAVGIGLNILLFAGKFLAGFLSGSIAIIADSLNNLSDAGSSVITLIGFKMSGQNPDKDHPFGHGRIEYIAGLLVAIAILFMGFELVKSSIGKIVHPQEVVFTPLTAIILMASIFVKLYMAFYNKKVGQKIASAAMNATATDSMSDTIATTVVLLTSLVAHFAHISLDGYCGVLVGIFVFVAGINAAKDTISPLLGQPPTKEFVEKIDTIIMGYESQGVLGMHDLVVHNYGPGRSMLSVHVEVPATGDILVLHDMIDSIEHKLRDELKCEAVIHMDPVCVDDEQTQAIKSKVAQIIEDMEGEVHFHDFRIVSGPTHTNIIFDVVVPYGYCKKDNEVVEYLKGAIQKLDNTYFAVIEVDKEYA